MPSALEFYVPEDSGIKYIGGLHQLLSAQLHMKASIASVPSSQYQELYRTNWAFTEFANLSQCEAPIQHPKCKKSVNSTSSHHCLLHDSSSLPFYSGP